MESILDSLIEQIAVINQDGLIQYVNQAWVNFSLSNGAAPGTDWIGLDYMNVFATESARHDMFALRAKNGLEDVLNLRTPAFSFEYPCDGENEKRWFEMRICALVPPCQNLYLVSHHNITQLKLVEEKLEYLSRHDALTALANRRYLEACLQEEWKRGMRQHTPLGLIMADIDHFKDYNDHHGHLEGDRCLRRVAEVLGSFARRPGDLAARFGGEEFVLVMVNTTPDQTREIAEAIRKKILALDIRYAQGKPLTISLGGVSATPSIEPPEVLIRRADMALYRAKQSGRNRVEMD